jgi:hypothetical protein
VPSEEAILQLLPTNRTTGRKWTFPFSHHIDAEPKKAKWPTFVLAYISIEIRVGKKFIMQWPNASIINATLEQHSIANIKM